MKVNSSSKGHPSTGLDLDTDRTARTENRSLKDETEIERALAFGEYIKNGLSHRTLQSTKTQPHLHQKLWPCTRCANIGT